MMGRFGRIAAGCAVAAMMGVMAASPASAALVYGTSGVCPATQVGTVQHSAHGGGLGDATDCNAFITFGANGSIKTTAGTGTNYESIEDALFGVVNNTKHAITSFQLTSTGSTIFGFDGDGIDFYTFDDAGGLHEANIGPVAGNPDTTGYGGLNAYFTNISPGLDSGIVNFANGGIAPGMTGFFSLELPAALNKIVVTNTPEPMSLTLLGAGLAGLAFRRRQAKKS
jgi:PEP-CTERM motif